MEERVPSHVAAGSGREALPKGSLVLCRGPQSAPTSSLSAGGRLCPLAARRGTTGLLAAEVRGRRATRQASLGRKDSSVPRPRRQHPRKGLNPPTLRFPYVQRLRQREEEICPEADCKQSQRQVWNPACRILLHCGVWGRATGAGWGAPGQRPEPGQRRQPFPHPILLRL